MLKIIFAIIFVLIYLIPTSLELISSSKRTKRTLIFPPTAPTRIQIIYGIGIPLDLASQSVTTGYVLKAEYFLPTLAYEIRPYFIPPPNKTAISTNANRKRSLDEGYVPDLMNIAIDPLTGQKYEKYSVEAVEIDESYDEPKSIDDSITQKEAVDPERKSNKYFRWAIYKSIETFSERLGFIGRTCILRSICEAAETPFTRYGGGILAELLHIIMTPSSSIDPLMNHSDNEYLHAELLGKSGAPCEHVFRECKKSLLDIFSRVFINDDFSKIYQRAI